jgi:2-haloacid dehalogenase
MKLTDFKVLSFDCYGTLIDWETGIWNALAPLVSAGANVDRETALQTYGAVEAAQEHETPGLLYRDILARVHAKLARAWNVAPNADMDAAFGGSIGDWPVFADTPVALTYLKRYFKLVILSNVDKQSFSRSNQKLGVAFDAICTAEDIGTYKPDRRNFKYLIDRVGDLGHDKSEILHTAQSLYHDHAPAEQLGIARCWINRRGDKGTGSGATKAVAHMPKLDFEFPTLAAMAEAHRREIG